MNNRELVIDVMNKLPEDAPLTDIIRELEFIAGVKKGDCGS